MTPSIAFVGAGPTTLYTLAALLAEGVADAHITVFERRPTAGMGMPYSPGWNDPAMLANIASIEIPPVQETLLHWLERQSSRELEAMGVAAHQVSERAFLPRLVLGRYFADQFQGLVRQAKAAGVSIEIRTGCRVIDACNQADGIRLTVAPHLGFVTDEVFDHVVLATGHQWLSDPEVRKGHFLSPWPASKLSPLPPSQVGILGSSLTAIDAAVALAVAHGDFVEQKNGDVAYIPRRGAEGFGVTMMSRKGLLPEADFYFPLPHAPLTVCTEAAVTDLIARENDDLLDQCFDLFRQELTLADPDYAKSVDLADATVESFGETYFAVRAATDPFVWARRNLDEARRNHESRFTIPWRDAILRMHEVVGAIVSYLDDQQFERFERWLKPVFVDNYGAVPHASIARLLALHEAGRLQVLALGEDYRVDAQPDEGCGGAIYHKGLRLHFPVFIEALGQRPLSAGDFPFPSLIAQGIIRDQAAAGEPTAVRGVALDDAFRPITDQLPPDRLFCPSLPFLMGQRPFAQGVTSSHQMGQIVGASLARAIGAAPAVVTPLAIAQAA
ncbi:hypothetical protein SH203_00748 [Brevundimonas sp. SH203]|uniref:FAD/NAD(P)-binding protein n=1 Tax=Brevundimonas sp. SH203 TaxID=345167 RepID=UPI0009CFD4F4|nr:FAD/NAD(P)-binding protein [Brevundimonas sp. SH203]GAW40351.1 hypothetical protein SH203_00748 [Brevundimonas sp. SH203]